MGGADWAIFRTPGGKAGGAGGPDGAAACTPVGSVARHHPRATERGVPRKDKVPESEGLGK